MACYLEDVLIFAPTVKEHDVLHYKDCRRGGIHLKEEKCQFSQKQVLSVFGILD